ncbi:MAG: PKD domain-containing protein [Bacteroidales bacterium]|nr:PKD domain-containing protein [Bacteroidales bacterium]MDD4214174.1 PKD domain-containing protein [Bacteroidales bacterium]
MKKTFLFVFLFYFFFNTVFAQAPVANFTANVTSGCGSLIVIFQDLSTNTPTAWAWNFGDGATSTLQNPTHNYTSPGTYSVTLTASNAFGSNTIVKSSYIHVYHLPVAIFSGTPLSGCSPLNVCFNSSSTPGDAPITTYSWDFGDGGSGSTQNPCHVYSASGNYQVTLIVTDQNNCSKSLIKPNYVSVGSKPTAAFTYSNPVPCNLPATVAFTNTSTPPGYTSLWSFGDGGTSTQQHPSHNYTAAGTYNIRLIVSNNGCSDTVFHPVVISANPFNANFTSDITSGCIPLTVNFTDLSAPNASSWLWNFGDGGTSSLQHPSHIYTSPGTYTVSLTSSNTGGCSNTKTLTNYITVFALPSVSFSGSPLQACHAPQNVSFTCSIPGIISWQWNFGDGGTSSAQNPSHTYTQDGIYTVTLSITDNHGCSNSLSKINYIIISPPIVDFTATPPAGCHPLTVHFNDSTSTISYITSWTWDFGDGSPVSHLGNPIHTYIDTGNYIVSLTVTDSAGCVASGIHAVSVGMLPLADFVADDTVGCHKHTVNFTNLSNSLANSWYWDFGDGGNATEENPEHTYADTGYFDVMLVAMHNGCPDTIIMEDYIYVMPPKPMFSATPTISCTYPVMVHFTDESILPETWYWTFGDGTSSTQQNPTHTYNFPGFYDVMLRVTNSNGCRDSLTMTAYIKISELIPDFIQDKATLCQHEHVAFMSTSYTNSTITLYNWDFGDGGTGTGMVTNNTFYDQGIYSIKLKVTDQLGCQDSITKSNLITVNPLPITNFSANITHGCAPMQVQFTDNSSAIPPATLNSWFWDFGDGSTSTQKNPQHTYLQPGVYSVVLVVTDSEGCDSMLVKQNYISVSRPVASFFSDTLKCNMEPVQFVNTSTGVGLAYQWDFGDGSPVSDSVNPIHNYDVNQTTIFDVTLTVTDSNGCDSSIVHQVRISQPLPGFYSDNNIANCPPFTVFLSDSSTSDVVSWYWTFGDTASGGNNHSSLENPQHIYNTSGVFDVQLNVVNIDGCSDSLLIPNFITVNGPAGSFSYTPAYGCAPLDVLFTANSLNTTSYFWVFGDGDAALTYTNNSSHTYNDGGAYFVSLVLDDSTHNCSLTLTAADSIRVISGSASFAYSSYTPCSSSANITFTDTSHTSQPVTQWLWDFGDGHTSTQQNPTHLYNTNGTFDVTLTIWVDSCSYTVTYFGIITVFIPPLITFDISGISTCTPPLISQFIVDDETVTDSVINWHWDFGDGTSGTGKNPTHPYSTTGNFTITLTTTFLNGCTYSYTNTFHVQVYNYPIAGFYTDTNNVLSDDYISFFDLSTGVDLHWNWYFGDGGISSSQNPVYSYSESDTYDVMLIVATPNGCADTAIGQITILDDVTIPNVFTPNGDGYNDLFEVITRGFSEYNMNVYNRWGKIVFHSTSPDIFWDGKLNGQNATEGTYYYVLILKNQVRKKELSGVITLIR